MIAINSAICSQPLRVIRISPDATGRIPGRQAAARKEQAEQCSESRASSFQAVAPVDIGDAECEHKNRRENVNEIKHGYLHLPIQPSVAVLCARFNTPAALAIMQGCPERLQRESFCCRAATH